MTITAPPDIDADIAQRHRRGQSIDQLVKVGDRTGWWTEADVDRVLTQAEQQTSARLEELEEELTHREVLAPSGHITDVLVHQEAAASVALDGETQVIGGAYTATGPRSVPDCVVELAPDTEVFDQQLAEAKATLPSPDQDDPAPPYVSVIRARELGVDHSYQRPLDEPRVARMAAFWNPRMLGTIDVSDRGPDENPRYAVINGQHRAAAAARVSPDGGDVWLACNIHEGLTVADEARLMYELDKSTKKLSGWDQWRARRGAGDPAVLTVDRVAARHGLQVDDAVVDGAMRSYGTAEKLLKLGGEQLLDSALAVLRAAYGTTAAAYQAPLLMGVGQLIHRYADVEMDRLTRALAATRPEQLRSTATALRDVDGGPLHELMTRTIVGQYNRTPGSGLRGRLVASRSA